jgi:hypothetical protein
VDSRSEVRVFTTNGSAGVPVAAVAGGLYGFARFRGLLGWGGASSRRTVGGVGDRVRGLSALKSTRFDTASTQDTHMVRLNRRYIEYILEGYT